jgi:hypothetical protein
MGAAADRPRFTSPEDVMTATPLAGHGRLARTATRSTTRSSRRTWRDHSAERAARRSERRSWERRSREDHSDRYLDREVEGLPLNIFTWLWQR